MSLNLSSNLIQDLLCNQVKQLKGPNKPVTHLCFGQNGYLVALFHLASSDTVESYHLNVWQVKSPTDISLVGEKTVEGSIMRVCVVKDLVTLICRPFGDWRKKNRLVRVTVYFLSITTLESVRNLSALGSSIATEVGDALVTVMPEGCIR